MRRSKRSIRIFLLDTNVFVSAVKDPKKQTASLKLILKIIEHDDIRLVGDEFLIEELVRYAGEFGSGTASLLLANLLDKIELVDPGSNFIKICRSYIRTPNLADVVHAAVCLRSNAVLISNDKHFKRIREEGIITVWSIGDAIKELI